MTDITDFFQKFPVKQLPKKRVLIGPGAELSSVYLLESGEVKMYSISSSGQETVIHLFKKGSIFPLMLIFANTPNRFYFESVGDAKLRSAPVHQVLKFLDENPSELKKIAISLSQGIMGLVTRVENLTNLSVSEQADSLTTHFGGRKFKQQEVANWLGTSRETISRAIRRRRLQSENQ